MSPRARGALVRLVIALVVIGGVVWFVRSRTSGSSGSMATGSASTPSGGGNDRVVPVQVALVEQKDLPIWLEGLGTVAALQQVTVRAQVDGRLDKVLFTEGQPVKQGEVLAQIDPRPFMVQLHTAEGALARDQAQLLIATRNHDRYRGLHEQKLVAQQQVDEIAGQVAQFEGAVKIDRAQVESARLQLDYAQVKAPLAGITGVRLVDAGNLVKASDATGLVVITTIDPAAVLFTVPQDRLSNVAAALARGDVPVEVWNRDGTERLSIGKLAVLDNQINQATATLRLKAFAPNPSRVLWPNAFVKARMLVETRTGALVIPAVAIQRGPQGSYVYLVAPDPKGQSTAVMRPVTVSLLTGDQAIIAAGLEVGDKVVVEGQSQLRPGGRVEPVKPTSHGKAGSGSAAAPSGSNQPPARP